MSTQRNIFPRNPSRRLQGLAPETISVNGIRGLIRKRPRLALELGLIPKGKSRRPRGRGYWAADGMANIPLPKIRDFIEQSLARLPQPGTVKIRHGVHSHGLRVESGSQLKAAIREIVVGYGSAGKLRLNLTVLTSSSEPRPADGDLLLDVMSDSSDDNQTMYVENDTGGVEVLKAYPAIHGGSGTSFSASDLPVWDDHGREFSEGFKRPFVGVHNMTGLNRFLRLVELDSVMTKIDAEKSGLMLRGVYHALLEFVPLPGLAMGGDECGNSQAMAKLMSSYGIVKVVQAGLRNLCVYAAVSAAALHKGKVAGRSIFRAGDSFMQPAQALYEAVNGSRLAKGAVADLVDVRSTKFHSILRHAGFEDPTKINLYERF